MALARMGPPRSACRVNWPGGAGCLAVASSNSALNRVALSRVGDTPADDSAAEDVDDDVEVEVRPFGRPHQLGDIPGPDLVGGLRQQLRLFVDRMAQLIAALADLLVCAQDAVHGADRAVVDALVEQAGIDLGGRLVGEARCAQKVEHRLAFHGGQRARGLGRGATRRRPGQTGAPAVNAGARHVQGCAGAGGQAGAGARATTASVMARRRCRSPAGCPAAPQLFFGLR